MCFWPRMCLLESQECLTTCSGTDPQKTHPKWVEIGILQPNCCYWHYQRQRYACQFKCWLAKNCVKCLKSCVHIMNKTWATPTYSALEIAGAENVNSWRFTTLDAYPCDLPQTYCMLSRYAATELSDHGHNGQLNQRYLSTSHFVTTKPTGLNNTRSALEIELKFSL